MKHIYPLLFITLLMLVSHASRASYTNTTIYEAAPTVYAADTIIDSNVQSPLVTETEDVFAPASVYVFPNPTFGSLSLEVSDDLWQGSIATLHNIIGETLDTRKVNAGSNLYDLAHFPRGFYFINLQRGEEQRTLRFVKR